MTTELIVMIFDQNEVTSSAWKVLQRLRESGSFDLQNAVLVERDVRGQAFIQSYKRYPAWVEALDDSFLFLFTNSIFNTDTSGDQRDLLLGELDEYFVKEIRKTWRPCNSALLIFVPRESLVDTQRLLDYLSGYSGKLIHTIIPVRIIESILNESSIPEPVGCEE